MTNLKRIYLLPEAEIVDLYERPIFNQNEQQCLKRYRNKSVLYRINASSELSLEFPFKTLVAKITFFSNYRELKIER